MSVSSTSNPNTRKTGQDTPDSANGSVDSGCSRDHEDQDQSIMEIDPQQLLNEWLSELENLQIGLPDDVSKKCVSANDNDLASKRIARQNSMCSSSIMSNCSSDSSSSGCISERGSNLSAPRISMEQLAYDVDFAVSTIKRKPSAMPKIPLTNTTRSLALASDDALVDVESSSSEEETGHYGQRDGSIASSQHSSNHSSVHTTSSSSSATRLKSGTLRRSATDERIKSRIYESIPTSQHHMHMQLQTQNQHSHMNGNSIGKSNHTNSQSNAMPINLTNGIKMRDVITSPSNSKPNQLPEKCNSLTSPKASSAQQTHPSFPNSNVVANMNAIQSGKNDNVNDISMKVVQTHVVDTVIDELPLPPPPIVLANSVSSWSLNSLPEPPPPEVISFHKNHLLQQHALHQQHPISNSNSIHQKQHTLHNNIQYNNGNKRDSSSTTSSTSSASIPSNSTTPTQTPLMSPTKCPPLSPQVAPKPKIVRRMSETASDQSTFLSKIRKGAITMFKGGSDKDKNQKEPKRKTHNHNHNNDNEESCMERSESDKTKSDINDFAINYDSNLSHESNRVSNYGTAPRKRNGSLNANCKTTPMNGKMIASGINGIASGNINTNVIQSDGNQNAFIRKSPSFHQENSKGSIAYSIVNGNSSSPSCCSSNREAGPQIALNDSKLSSIDYDYHDDRVNTSLLSPSTHAQMHSQAQSQAASSNTSITTNASHHNHLQSVTSSKNQAISYQQPNNQQHYQQAGLISYSNGQHHQQQQQQQYQTNQSHMQHANQMRIQSAKSNERSFACTTGSFLEGHQESDG
ncbi:unnamed protein product [Sphagnum balticum]